MLMHELTLGPASPIVALLFAALGVLLGILLATRARGCTGIRRARLVAYATVAIAVPAVWLPALVATMALSVDGSVLLLAPIPLATSLGAAVLGTFAGLLLVCYGRSSRTDRILSAGILMVGTIAGTGYLLLHGLRTGGEITFRPPFAAAALALALITGLALTGALAVTPTLRSALLMSGALGALMAACQHLGAASLAVRLTPQGPVPAYDITGITPLAFGLPTVVLCGALIAMTWYFTVGAATARDLNRTFQNGAQTEQIEPSIVAEVSARVSLSSTALVAAGIGEVWSQGTLPLRAIPLYSGGVTGAFVRPLIVRTAQEPTPQPQDDEPGWEPAGADEPTGQPEPAEEEPWRAVPNWGLPTAEWVEQPELDTAGWLARGREAGAAGHWEQTGDADAGARNEQRGARPARPTNSRYGPMPRRGNAANTTAAEPERVPVAHWGGGSGELPTITRVDSGDPLPRRNSR